MRVFITGASSGIGFACALRLINNAHTLIAPCRDLSTAEKTRKKLKSCCRNYTQVIEQSFFPVMDLSDLESINTGIMDLERNKLYFDAFVFNAGLQYTGSIKPRFSAQNFELTFAVNHLSHQYLLQKLIPMLNKNTQPRVIITASEVHNPYSPGGKIGAVANLGALKGLKSCQPFLMLDGSQTFNADKAYKDSKACNILFGKELFRRLDKLGTSIPVICWAPGLVIPNNNSGFFRYSRKYNELGQRLFAFAARDLFKITESPEKSGQILYNLITETTYRYAKFSYYSNRIIAPNNRVFEISEVSEEANNEELALTLWEQTAKLVNLSPELNMSN